MTAALEALEAGLNASGIVPDFSLSFGPDDPEPITGLIYTPDGYDNVIITIPDFETQTGCTYRLNHSDDGFSTSSTDQNVSPNDAPTFGYQLGRQWRVDIIGDVFIVIGEPTSPLP